MQAARLSKRTKRFSYRLKQVEMDLSDVITALISVAALLLGGANYWRTRRDRDLENRLAAERFIDEAYDLLAPEKGGFFQIKDLARRQDARNLIQRAVMLGSSSPRVVRFQGYVYEADGDRESATRCFEQLLRTDESRWEGYMGLGRITSGEERMSFYSEAVACDLSRSAEPLFEIAKAHSLVEDVDQAISYLQRSIDINDDYAVAHYEMGLLFEKRGQISEAKQHLERAISIDPTYVDAMVRLGSLLIHAEESWDDGCRWILQAMHTDPTDDWPHAMMAAIHLDRGEPEEAHQHLERASELNPTRRLGIDETSRAMFEEIKMLLRPGMRSQFEATPGAD